MARVPERYNQDLTGGGGHPHHHHRGGGGWRGGGYWGGWPPYVVQAPPEDKYVLINPAGHAVAVVSGIPSHLPKGWTFRRATPGEAATGRPEKGMSGVFGDVDSLF